MLRTWEMSYTWLFTSRKKNCIWN